MAEEIVVNIISQTKPNQVVFLKSASAQRAHSLLLNWLEEKDHETRYVLRKVCLIEHLEIAPKDRITLAEWLLEQNVELDKSTMAKVSAIVSERYLELYGSPAPQIKRRSKTGNLWNNKSRGYLIADTGLFEEALKAVQRTLRPEKPFTA
jgi:hypothetical protein